MGLLTTLAAGAVLLGAPLLGRPEPWDGTNPFAASCELQQAGLEAAGPDPSAEPYCVEFDKRRQNLDRLGLLEFVLKEPARVAAAVGKCRYFQADHWRGSIVQADGRTKTYEFDGRYFFDKSTGNGGVRIDDFSLGGRSADPSKFLPPGLREYAGPGSFGVITRNALPLSAACR